MTAPAFQLIRPIRQDTSVVFASPHSGRNYPAAFCDASHLSPLQLRSSEDAFVDTLFEDVPEYGAPFLRALAPRAWIDLNRSDDELDPALIEDLPRRHHNNPRIASGLGVIPRVVAGAREIQRGRISLQEARSRLRQVWYPYHEALAGLMTDTHDRFGQAILVDLHSMPHEALDVVARNAGSRPEVVIGDRFGSSSSGAIVDGIEAAFAGAGFSVVRNIPFAGAYIVNQYGRPRQNRHAVQIEIDRSLYMNEATVQPNENFDCFQRLMKEISAEISALGRPAEQNLAAE